MVTGDDVLKDKSKKKYMFVERLSSGEDLASTVPSVLASITNTDTKTIEKIRALTFLQRVAGEVSMATLTEVVFPTLANTLRTKSFPTIVRSQVLFCIISLCLQCELLQHQRRMFETLVSLLLDTLLSKDIAESAGLRAAAAEGLREVELMYPTVLSDQLERIAPQAPLRLLSAVLHNKLLSLVKQMKRKVLLTTRSTRKAGTAGSTEFILPASMSLSGCPMVVKAYDTPSETLKLNPYVEILSDVLKRGAALPVASQMVEVLLPMFPFQSLISHDFLSDLKSAPLMAMLVSPQDGGGSVIYPSSDAIIHLLLFGHACVLAPFRTPPDHLVTFFHPSDRFTGSKEGMFFGRGPFGLGYYKSARGEYPFSFSHIHKHLMSRRCADHTQRHAMLLGIHEFQKCIEHVQGRESVGAMDEHWIPSHPWDTLSALRARLMFLCEDARHRPVCAKYVVATLSHMHYVFTDLVSDIFFDVVTCLVDSVSMDTVTGTIAPWMVHTMGTSPHTVTQFLNLFIGMTSKDVPSLLPLTSESLTSGSRRKDNKAEDTMSEVGSRAGTMMTEVAPTIASMQSAPEVAASTPQRPAKMEALAAAMALELIQKSAQDKQKPKPSATLATRPSLIGKESPKGRTSLLLATGFTRELPTSGLQVTHDIVAFMPILEWAIANANMEVAFWDALHMYCWRVAPSYKLGTAILTLIRSAIKKKDTLFATEPYTRVLVAILTLMMRTFPDASFRQESAVLRALVQRSSPHVVRSLLEDPTDLLSLFVINETGKAAQQSIARCIEPSLLTVAILPTPHETVSGTTAGGTVTLAEYLRRLEEGGAPASTPLHLEITLMPHATFQCLLSVAIHFLRTPHEMSKIGLHHTWNVRQKVAEVARDTVVAHPLAPITGLRFPAITISGVTGTVHLRPIVAFRCEIFPVAVASCLTGTESNPIANTIIVPMPSLHISLHELAVTMSATLHSIGLPNTPHTQRALWEEIWRNEGPSILRGLHLVPRETYTDVVAKKLAPFFMPGGSNKNTEAFCFFPPRCHLLVRVEPFDDSDAWVTAHVVCDHVTVLSSVDDWFRTLAK